MMKIVANAVVDKGILDEALTKAMFDCLRDKPLLPRPFVFYCPCGKQFPTELTSLRAIDSVEPIVLKHWKEDCEWAKTKFSIDEFKKSVT